MIFWVTMDCMMIKEQIRPMVTLDRIKSGQVRAQMRILNSDPCFNRVTKGQDSFSLEEALAEIHDSEVLGTERYFIVKNEEQIGILEFLMENPADDSTWLGLLLIAKEHQRKGYGTAVFRLFCTMMVDRGVYKFRIGVSRNNEPAHKFWRKMGFKPIDRITKRDGREIIISEFHLMPDSNV